MFRKIPFLQIYHLGNFDNYTQSGFSVIVKIAFANLCKPFYDIKVNPVSSNPLNLENVERKEKMQKIEYLQNKKSFLDEIKNIFQSC